MAENRYDQTTGAEPNANEQAARVSLEQQRTNGPQQQAQAAQQASTPDPAVQLKQNKPEQEVRRQQATGQGMGIW